LLHSYFFPIKAQAVFYAARRSHLQRVADQGRAAKTPDHYAAHSRHLSDSPSFTKFATSFQICGTVDTKTEKPRVSTKADARGKEGKSRSAVPKK
jgi:hypothetical protein